MAYPNIDWKVFGENFTGRLGLKHSFPTTQIEHYDHMAALFDTLKRINTILLDLDRDIWTYISMDYFKQQIKKGEVGSSAMPHKVNPISTNFSSVIAATATWLLRAYPPAEGALSAALAEAQVRQAVTVAAWLRHPSPWDASLAAMAGPGGAQRLDRLVGADTVHRDRADLAWRTWVDEVVASWAACLLTAPDLARTAVAAIRDSEHLAGAPVDFRRLTAPDEFDRRAAPLLRHPDLLAPIAGLHRQRLLQLLGTDPGRHPGTLTGTG